ncbi:MAG: hypothetical protein ACYC0V_18940 [Armatimonadota bacterium]
MTSNGKMRVTGDGIDRCKVSYLDCDVEEPRGRIFLKPFIEKTLQTPLLLD